MKRFVLCLAIALVTCVTLASPANAAPPSNDNFVDALAITSLPYAQTINVAEATQESADTCYSAWATRTIWYSYTPETTTSAYAAFRLDGQAGNDSAVATYVLGTSGALTELECAIWNTQPRQLTAGTTYYFMAATGGPFDVGTFALEETPPPVSSVSLTVSGGAVKHDGLITMSGMISCDQESAWGLAILDVAQGPKGRAAASLVAAPGCGPVPRAFTASGYSDTTASFLPGPALLSYIGVAENAFGHAETHGTVNIILKRSGADR